MALDRALEVTVPETPTVGLFGRGRRKGRQARPERQRLARQARVSARLAELHQIRGLLGEARALVSSGWVQHDWFAYRDDQGRERTVGVQDAERRLAGREVTGACLVGAIVHAGGGPAAAREQRVQRALDLTWHTLYAHDGEPVQWSAAPPVRVTHVRELTRWNDDSSRRGHEVVALLGAVEQAAAAESARLRSDSGQPAPREAVTLG